jgi:CheY-like chemotaxis protein
MADLVASTSGPRVVIRVEIPPHLPAIRTDPHQLEMAILNLAVNARDAMPEGGVLTLSASEEAISRDEREDLQPGRYIRLQIADTGSGMDEETLSQAVVPFFSTKGVGQGTGLGLSMVHGLAAQLGGSMHIWSKLGVGTSIDLWLPLSGDGITAPENNPAHSETRHFGAVLLVDDEPLIRMSTADILTDMGYSVTEAGSAEDALQLVADGFVPDVLITDHLMPGLTGTQLARRIRDQLPKIVVLIISGYAEVEGIAPDVPRLTKPFRENDLAQMLKGITNGASISKESSL